MVPPSVVDALREQYLPELPPIEGGAYLIGYLFDVGPTVSGAMGAAVVSSKDLAPWCEESGVELTPWEARTVRRLSGEYLVESHRAEKRDCRAPWRQDDSKPEVSATQQALRNLANL